MQTIQAYNIKWENFHPRMGVQALQSVKMRYMYMHSLDEFYFGSGCKTSRGCISNNKTCSLVWRKCFPHKVREEVDLKQVFINLHAALPFNSPETSPYNIFTLSSKQVLRIFKLIEKELISWSNTKFLKLIHK